MLFNKELNPDLNSQKDFIRAKLYVDSSTLLFVSPWNSFAFVIVPISFIIDVIMTLRERVETP